jgi:beta-mannosidase
VDYYAKVWLNDALLGQHEGYFEPFEFEVGHLLSRDKPNVLVVRVSSPWDAEENPGDERRVWHVGRDMLKGTYEHADTFVQRDVNPVGIWQPVSLTTHSGIRAAKPVITPRAEVQTNQAEVVISWAVTAASAREVSLEVCIRAEPEGLEVARLSMPVHLGLGENELGATLCLDAPRLWNTWDRGGPALYRAELEIRESGRTAARCSETFGIRTVEVRRTAEETTFLLNGNPLFLRGSTYFPDVYLSAMDRGRYERDIAAAVRAGVNAFRVHVHVENEAFYEICDRMGVAVFQDSDINWSFPTEQPFERRALAVFGGMIRKLRNHPAILCWICMNEAKEQSFRTYASPGPQLVAEARRLDPTRPTIRNSCDRDDPESGDTHDYAGCFGGHYTEIYGGHERLLTEFGQDAPPAAERARLVPRIASKLKDVLPRVAELHDYQYRLIKYTIEYYRMQKYSPCSGYFQFMWIDLCPQSFYGIYDYWGCPKVEGMGGGLKALEESNAPVGIFMEYSDAPVALHAVNDTLENLGQCIVEWAVVACDGNKPHAGKETVSLAPDSHVRVGDLSFPTEQAHRVLLTLRRADGRLLARNLYREPFNHPLHPEGHPDRMEHEMGMRLWWAGTKG